MSVATTVGSAVLVHGLWGHPEDWRWVAALLEQHGVAVVTPDLPSHASPHAGLADDAAYVRRAVERCAAPLVAVGWSYGGDVLSMATAGGSPVQHLVYVSAVPRPATDQRFDTTWLENDPKIHVLSDGRYVLDTELWLAEDDTRSFYPDVLEHLRRFPRRPASAGVDDPQTEAGWQGLPVTVLVGAADALVPAGDLAAAAERGAHLRVLDTDHFVIFRQPEAVADAVVAALASLDASHSA